MPHRQQLAADLSAMEQRIEDGDAYLQRMRELLVRTRGRSEDTGKVDEVIAEMEATQQGFLQRRDELAKALDEAGPAS